MSNQTFDDLRDVAEELIAEFGEKVTWVRIVNPTPETSSKPWRDEDVPSGADSSVETEVTVIVAFLPDDRDGRETRNYSRRSVVPKGNTTAYMTKPGFEPSLKDILRRTSISQSYNIESIVRIRPNADDVILYKMRLG